MCSVANAIRHDKDKDVLQLLNNYLNNCLTTMHVISARFDIFGKKANDKIPRPIG